MNSIILQTATRLLVPIQVVFSLFLLVRGHNDPGGGFIGGLVIAAALGLYALAFSPEAARSLLRVQPSQIVGGGLLVVLASGMAGVAGGQSFLGAQWVQLPAPASLEIGTPLVFDAGIYLMVLGVGAAILFSFMGDAED